MSLPRVKSSFASLYSVMRLAKCKANLNLFCFDNIKADFHTLSSISQNRNFYAVVYLHFRVSMCEKMWQFTMEKAARHKTFI
jgi:hypothetical protein